MLRVDRGSLGLDYNRAHFSYRYSLCGGANIYFDLLCTSGARVIGASPRSFEHSTYGTFVSSKIIIILSSKLAVCGTVVRNDTGLGVTLYHLRY